MTAKDVVKTIMIDKSWSQSKLASEAGFESQSNVTGILNRGTSLRVDNLVKMVNAMGYKIVVVPKEMECPDKSYEIE